MASWRGSQFRTGGLRVPVPSEAERTIGERPLLNRGVFHVKHSADQKQKPALPTPSAADFYPFPVKHGITTWSV